MKNFPLIAFAEDELLKDVTNSFPIVSAEFIRGKKIEGLLEDKEKGQSDPVEAI